MAIQGTATFPYTAWDQFKDWKELVPAENGNEKLEYRVARREARHTIISVRGKTRQEVVARHLKSLLADNQAMFGLHGAGIEHYSGAIPLYNNEKQVAGYLQDFRFTNGL